MPRKNNLEIVRDIRKDAGLKRLPTLRCDECDNGIESDVWVFCPFCGKSIVR